MEIKGQIVLPGINSAVNSDMRIEENLLMPTPMVQGKGNISLSTMNSSEKIPSSGSDIKKWSPQNGFEMNELSKSQLLSKKSYTEIMVHRFKKMI